MRQEIKLKGVSNSPSDYMSPDGELSLCLGMIPQDGELHPSTTPKVIDSNLEKDEIVLLVHRTSTQENYITYKNTQQGTLVFFRKVGTATREKIDFPLDKKVSSATSVGNSVIVTTEDSLYYLLWKDGKYISLGDKIPEFTAAPFLDTRIEDSQSFYTKYGPNLTELSVAILSGDNLIPKAEAQKLFQGKTTSIPLYGEMRTNVYNRLFATLNLFRNELRKNGSLTEPFFIRFAYRMYNGEHTMQTSPILLIPNSDGQPIAIVKIDSSGNVTSFPFFAASRIYVNYILPENIDLWSDILTHIDIFISSPITNYTDSAEALESLDLIDAYNDSTGVVEYDDALSPFTMTTMNVADNKQVGVVENLYKYHRDQNGDYDVTPLNIKSESMYLNVLPFKEYKSQYLIVDTQFNPNLKIFFAQSGIEYEPVKEVPFDPPYSIYKAWYLPRLEPWNRFVLFEADNGFPLRAFYYRGPTNYSVENPKFRIRLKRTDGKSYNELFENASTFYKISEIEIPKIGQSQNPLEVSIKENTLNSLEAYPQLSDLGQARSRFVSSGSFVYNSRINVIVDKEYPPICTSANEQVGLGALPENDGRFAYVEIKENSQTTFKKIAGNNILYYFSYPSRNAVFLHLYYKYNSYYQHYKIPLKKNLLINSAFAFTNLTHITDNYVPEIVKEMPNITDEPITYGNKIITSGVNNPFVFRETDVSVIPADKVYALSSATKALSEGQFGQFPMYAFTSEGVWALEVNKDGTFAAPQAVVRDVCKNPESITQIDDAVLYITERGIMMLSGASSICITDILNGSTLSPSDLQGLEDVSLSAGFSLGDITPVEFLAFLNGARITYDYTHQRIVVYNPDREYAYQFSLKDKMWGMLKSDFKRNVNSYPEAIVATKDNLLVDLTKEEEQTLYPVLVVTRPFKLGGPDIHKTIDYLYTRGDFLRFDIGSVLWASNDLVNWFLVNSSRDHRLQNTQGTPFKYFRLALVGKVKKGNTITSSSVDFRTKDTNHMR